MAEKEEKKKEEPEKEEKKDEKNEKKKPREKPSPSKSDRRPTSSSDSGNQYQKQKMAGQLPQQPESDTRRKKLNQLKEQFAQLKSRRKSIEGAQTDEDIVCNSDFFYLLQNITCGLVSNLPASACQSDTMPIRRRLVVGARAFLYLLQNITCGRESNLPASACQSDTMPIKAEEKPLVEEVTAIADVKKETENEKKTEKTVEALQTEKTARTSNTRTTRTANESQHLVASDNLACRHAPSQTNLNPRDQNSFKRFFRIISSSSSKKKKYKEAKGGETSEADVKVIRSLPIAAPQYEDDYGVQHKFDGYTTREDNTDAVQTLKAQMESKNQSRDRCVKILSWTMKVAAIVCVILSILVWIAVYMLTLRISNNTFEIVRV